jgi:hypothetical protein
MQSIESEDLSQFDLVESQPEPRLPAPTPSLAMRLHAYGILPPGHEKIREDVLVLVEQIFVTWYELRDDDSRRRALRYLIGSERELRETLLAVVPLYFDPLYFDERTPTRELVEIVLVAHRKWRTWLDQSRS